ncbi:UvrD-like helicase, ATP-binding domain, P-loop containing nucleoside triphosphate hydrolase, partial [Tanacetum coccineum]
MKGWGEGKEKGEATQFKASLPYRFVEKIPLSFESEHHYFSFKESKSGENMLYDVTISPWKNQFSKHGKDAYHTLAGDLLILVKECSICRFGYNSMISQKLDPHLLVNLNESQTAAVMAALCKTQCCHISSVEQIWGPPGTGKTMTVSILLFILLQMKQRTLTCAPTNVAIVQLASRVLSLVRESFKTTTASGDYFCSVGDLLLFGNKEILKVSTDIEEIYLEHRVKRLAECLGPVT